MPDYDVTKVIEDVTGRQVRAYSAAAAELLAAHLTKNRPKAAAARRDLGEVIREANASAETLGAIAAFKAAALVVASGEKVKLSAERRVLLNFSETAAEKIIHRVPFEEALEDFVDRVPVTLRDAAERTAANISRLYSEAPVTAFVKAAESSVTKEAKSVIFRAMKDGIPESEVGKSLKFGVDKVRQVSESWSEGYSRMAFRTNVNTAVTAGRFRAVRDPEIRLAVPAFRFTATGDGDTRPDHQDLDGLIFDAMHSVWSWLATPIDYNCRCSTDHMSAPELRRMGRLGPDGKVVNSKVPSWRPDSGFMSRGIPGGGSVVG